MYNLKVSIDGPVPFVVQERRRDLLLSLHGAIHQNPQVGGHQVYEEEVRDHRKGKETQVNTSP